MSNGCSVGSSGMTSGGSRSTMASPLVSLTNMHVVWSNLWRPFLMVLCIVVLECLVQVMTWSPKASIPHMQRSRCWGQRGSHSFRFSITVNSLFGRQFLGSRRVISMRDADILGSKRSSSWDKVSTSLLDSRRRQSKTFGRLDVALLICSLHLLVDDRSRKRSLPILCGLFWPKKSMNDRIVVQPSLLSFLSSKKCPPSTHYQNCGHFKKKKR